MSMDDTFSENAPTISPQIRTLRLVEHVRPEQEQAYLEWSREFSDAHANFIAARDPESWSSVVMIRDRLCGNQMSRRISAHGPIMTSTPSTRRLLDGVAHRRPRIRAERHPVYKGLSVPRRRNIPGVDGFRRATGNDPQRASFELRGR
jgi:hypothetical protein